ncbi:MAG: tetratricopeptide repeat protein [Alphaproteobacteria bacterium]
MRDVEFRLDGNFFDFGDGATRERRVLSDADWARFADWTGRYHEQGWMPRDEAALLELGRQIHDWLDGVERWLERLRQVPGSPVIAAFAVRARPDEQARRFLEVPWELAADSAGHLAADAAVMWAPLRRVGPRSEPMPPNAKHRLGVMFMAAAPIGAIALDFDAEEAAVLRATERVGLDLVVEDSGNLDELCIAWKDEGSLDALHLSCHGAGGEEPALALEGLGGETEVTGLGKLARAFAEQTPRLLFLSACHTGENDATVDSLALGLVGAGVPAVLGWADAVYDSDASAFAAAFYKEAAHRNTPLEAAWAVARFSLLNPQRSGRTPAHWHLARLFLGPSGGGPLAAGRDRRLAPHPDAGRKGIVEARGTRIEVASRFEFVGRRREIQAIRREFRQPEHAGVLIHGLGRQGKSSLAARIMDRHPDLASVVLFQRCDGPSVLAAIRDKVSDAREICERYRERVDPSRQTDYDPEALYDALRDLLEGPCCRVGSGEPILLVLDDFEALLDLPVGSGHWRVKAEARAPLAAIIRAFDRGGTGSRLLITSRYEFHLGGAARDLAQHLLDIALPEMSPANRLKQARQKLLALGRPALATELAELSALPLRAIAAARGNAGLQDLLFGAVLADPVAGEAAVDALERYLAGGALPEQEVLRATLENLVIEKLIGALTDSERMLLRESTLFKLPVPLPVWKKFADGAGLGSPDRLLAFGLWERLPDIVDARTDAAAANAIAVARLPPPPKDDERRVITSMLDDLFAAWGGADRSKTPIATDIELARLALLSGNLDVLAATAFYAIRGLEHEFDYREAAATAKATLDALEAGGRAPTVDLLRAAAEVFDYVGDLDGLRRVYAQAPRLGSDDPSGPADQRLARARFRGRYGAYLAQQGEPEQALEEFRAAQVVFETLGDRRARAVTLGDIARIMVDRGEIDEALKLHQERLKTYEALGDRRERAITLGDIARIMANKGEVDEALKLHQEQLAIFDTLGDRRARAIALGDIAQIMADKGEVDEALKLHQEQVIIFETLGDRHERAATLGYIARIMADKGEADEALKLLQEQVSFFDALGARRERAVALGDIAHIMREKGNIDDALKLHQEELETYKALGDPSAWATTLGNIAYIMTEKGNVDDALKLQEERLRMDQQLGDQAGIAVASFEIGKMRLSRAAKETDIEAFRLAVDALAESHGIFTKMGRLDGICAVGAILGQALAMGGQLDQAREILQRSLGGFRKLGRPQEAAQVEAFLRQLE